MSLAVDVQRLQLAPTHALLRLGWTSRQLSRGVARGEIIRVRQGWYCTPEFPEVLQRSARVGGSLTCVSAARMLGLATIETPTLHVSVPRTASRLRSAEDYTRRLDRTKQVIVHWSGVSGQPVPVRAVADVLFDMAFCCPVELTIAAVDSALHSRLLTSAAWGRCLRSMPNGLAQALAAVDGRAEAITESLVRTRLAGLGLASVPQVKVPGVGRVDLLIGTSLVIELDGRAFHDTESTFENDRRRDARLSIRGFRVLRFSYWQVMSNWAQVRDAILAAVRRGDHLGATL